MAADAERVRRAALVAPLAVLVVLWLAWAVETTPSMANRAAGFWGLLLVGGAAGYVAAGVLGWPVYRILRRLDAVWLTTCLASGFLIGVTTRRPATAVPARRPRRAGPGWSR